MRRGRKREVQWREGLRQRGYSAVTLGYTGSELHLPTLLPDTRDGVTALMRALTAEQLVKLAKAERREIKLWMPKFEMAPTTMDTSARLQQFSGLVEQAGVTMEQFTGALQRTAMSALASEFSPAHPAPNRNIV